MIIYKDQRYSVSYKEIMDQINQSYQIVLSSKTYESLTDLIINVCELETAAADYFFKESDGLNSSVKILKETNILLASALYRIFINKYHLIELNRIKNHLGKISLLNIPDNLAISIPEGLAYYSYYPEMFFQSTEQFIAECKPKKVICIGIRTIGTIYSSAAAAVLRHHGINESSYTVRTRGDFENRYLKLSKELIKEFSSNKESYFLIIDEGPGLSGSSFGVTSRYLKQIGIPPSNIFFLSTRNPESNYLISEVGREEWGRYKTFYINNKKFFFKNLPFFGVENYKIIDISHGLWRNVVYKNGNTIPPADIENERKKYLISFNDRETVMKYLGLGKYGKRYLERGQMLSQKGFIPELLNFRNGYISYKMESGINLSSANEPFLKFAVKYFSFLKTFKANPSHTFEEMFMMIIENISEICPPDMAQKVKNYEAKFSKMYSADSYEVDGRVLPFEWIQTANGYKKLDSLEHHNDHYFPGAQNILWDAAGLIVEFNLDSSHRKYFLDLCRTGLNEPEAAYRISFYIIAYSSFRLAYSNLLSDLFKNNSEGIRFGNLRDYYSDVITKEMERLI